MEGPCPSLPPRAWVEFDRLSPDDQQKRAETDAVNVERTSKIGRQVARVFRHVQVVEVRMHGCRVPSVDQVALPAFAPLAVPLNQPLILSASLW